MADDFERAVVCLFDVTASPQNKQSAEHYCSQIVQRHDVWKLYMERLCRFESRSEVKFWCLQNLSTFLHDRSSLLQPNDFQLIRQGLMSWITEIAIKQDIPVFIKNKFAQTIVILLKLLYPIGWPTFFKELFSTLTQGERAVDIYVRILDAIDHEIVSHLIDRPKEDHIRNTQIKDAMREDCIPDMVNTWYTIIEARHPTLSLMCLKVMPGYIDWIDITLITNEKFMKLFFSLIGNPEYRNEVCDCLYEISIKGMPASEKLALLARLQLPDLVKSISYDSDQDDQFAARIAKLTNAISTQLVECCTALQQDNEKYQISYNLLNSLLPLGFKLFGDKDDEVSSNMVTFLSSFMMQLKAKQKFYLLTEQENQYVVNMIQIIRNKARYTDDFNFDPLSQDEYEAGFLEYRRELMVLFKNTVRLAPDMVKEFTKSSLLHALNNQANIHFSEVEIGLTLFHQIGEIFTEEIQQQNTPNEASGYFEQLLAAIIEASKLNS
jgi:exportin-T